MSVEGCNIVAIDFDGTIVEHEFPEMGDLKPYAKEVINKLHEEGYYIIIWTCRGEYGLIDAINFLKENEIHFDKINENAPYEMICFKPSPKIFANFYVDDRNVGVKEINWKEIYKQITGEEFE
jgi:histidinol phosphatase-like enzyme